MYLSHEKTDEIYDVYSLTPLQEGILFHYMADPESKSYISQDVYVADAVMDGENVKETLYLLEKKYASLKTNIIYDKLLKPRQVIHKKGGIAYDEILFTGSSEREKYEKIENLSNQEISRGFALQKDSLIRVKHVVLSNKSVLIWTYHHILLDGWSISLVMDSFIDNYSRLQRGTKTEQIEQELASPALPGFSTYVEWVNMQDKKSAADYWKQLTYGYETVACIKPMIQPVKSEKQVERIESYISEELTQRLSETAKKSQVTINNMTETAWGIVLQKYNYTDDVIFGKIVSGRDVPIEGIEDIAGLCINTIPIRIKTEKNMSVEQLIQNAKNQGIDSKEYEYFALAEIQGATSLKSDLIKTLFVFENYQNENRTGLNGINHLNLDFIKTTNQTNYELTVNVAVRENRLRLAIKYDPNQYVKEEVSRILNHFSIILNIMATTPWIKVDDIEIATQDERKLILDHFNDTEAEYPSEKTVIELFEAQAMKTPDLIAVAHDSAEITYAQLNGSANMLATQLRAQGVKPNDFVAILARRSIEMIIGIYGILKAGGAYVPIDPEYPAERIAYILQDCKPKAVLVYKAGIQANIPVVDLQQDYASCEHWQNLASVNSPNDLIYCTYTSGTTGRPKGIPVIHKNVVNLITWYKSRFAIAENCKNLLLSSLSFDLTSRNIFGPHIGGGCVCLCGQSNVYDLKKSVNYIRENQVTMINCAATAFYALISADMESDYVSLKSLRKVYLCGEVLKYDKIKAYLLSENNEAEIVNGYGATEDSGIATAYSLDKSIDYSKGIPIGKALSNKQIYIVENHNLCGIGVRGEICICGAGITAGYLNNAELTAEKFVENPFGYGKMYRTGDLGIWMPNGDIEFWGRKDSQVKIRGQRIEMGEIESTLLKQRGIKDCTVIARTDKQGEQVICAYFVSDLELCISDIKEELSKSLPFYMIPAFVEQIKEIPVTENGKLNINLLPKMEIKRINKFVPPKDKNEAVVLNIIQQVLNLEKVGMLDNIFELGANSINVMYIVNRLNQIGYKVNINTVMKSNNIMQIVRGMDRNLKVNLIGLKEELV